MAKQTIPSWGFDIKTVDSSVRPQDDFYSHVSNNWFKTNPIPADESRWGSFQMLALKTQKQLRAILTELEAAKKVSAGSPEQMIRDFYRSGMDMERRNALGNKPLMPWLARIEKIKSQKDILPFLWDMHAEGLEFVWGFGIDQDSKNSEKYALHIGQGGLGLPERDYYLNNDEESQRVRNGYVQYIKNMLRLLGRSKKETEAAAVTILRLETRFARAWMTKEDRREPELVYNKKTLAQLEKFIPSLKWPQYLKKIGAQKADSAIFMQLEFFAEVAAMLEEEPVEDWKTYFTFHMTSAFSAYLTAAYARENFNFFGKVVMGRKKMRPLWRQVLSVVDSSLDELLGQIYVERYFSPEAKKKMHELVDDLFAAFEARIKRLDWMSDMTKKKAVQKLHAIDRKIGYPDKWKKYTGLEIRANDYVGNVFRTSAYEQKREMKKLGKPIDRTEWFMSPQMVNAYYNPNMNDIGFPAAILQFPFFDATADAALNYGSIGWTIGHELTHAFDDQGSKFDYKGNLKTWWTPEDKQHFDAKSQIIRKQFDAYEIEGMHVNGQLTLGENIADLGGIAIAYDAYQKFLERHGRTDIDGLTPEQRFFFALAQGDAMNARPEFTKMQVLTDPHAPSIFRVNGPLSNLETFYDAFDLKEGDMLYRAPGDRAKIW